MGIENFVTGNLIAVGRYMDGTSVVGYKIRDTYYKSENECKKDHVIRLIQQGQIKNMRLQKTKDGFIIRGNGTDLKTLPVYDAEDERKKYEEERCTNFNKYNKFEQFKVVGRYIKDNKVIGYHFISSIGKEYRYNIQETIQLVKNKPVINLGYELITIGGTKLKSNLIGKYVNLNTLKVYNINTPVCNAGRKLN